MIRSHTLALVALLLSSSLAGCRQDVVLATEDAAIEDAGSSGEGGPVDGATTDGGSVEDDAGVGPDGGTTCGEPCDPSECPPASDLEEMCEDSGWVSASSDRCLRTDEGTCRWELIRCPEDRACADDSLCGPAPGAPAITCADGSTGGNTGRCLLQPDGSCAWQIRECPGDTCAAGRCGAEPTIPNEPCPDGVNESGPTGRCLEDPGGTTCSWEIADCPWHEPFCR